MRFVTEASKLLTNKYFLYFMVFLAATNVLGYLVTNKVNAVIFFALVSLLTYHFSKNMAIVLLVAIIATNFLMANKRLREGLENPTNVGSGQALNNIENKDPQIATAIPVVKSSQNNEQVASQIGNVNNRNPVATAAKGTAIKNKKLATADTSTIDTSTADTSTTDTSTTESFTGEVEGVGRGGTNKKGNSSNGSRLDYAATIEESYANLDNILGGESINKLTGDTKKLMQQQQKLFDTMQNMAPVLKSAQEMLKGFNINDLANSLKSMGGSMGGNSNTA